MKLSAPPPPPSDGTPAPGEQPDASAPAAPASEAPESPPVFTPKPLAWPAWYAGMDAALAGLVLVFAFAAASFVARNSDVWLHLAAGKRLFAGQYTPGSDPFSYSATDRAWVNHSWLTDAVAYLLYGGEGKVLVVAKALVVVLAFGLLIAIRRPKFPLWPWAAVACVAVLAAAPQFTLRPLVVSMLFLAVTLFLLFRMPQKANSWRFPGAIGVTFWLWANSDPWFFVGPMALALLVVGDLIQEKLLKSPDEPASDSDDEPLGRLPDTLTLAKALGVGVLACMLNPHHVRVWELPFELVGAAGADTDPRVQQLLFTPISGEYHKNATLGENANGLAYAVLFVGGAAALGFGYGRLRVAHVALWIGFAALSLLSIFAIPLFAVVAVPLVAAQLNAFGARAELKTWGDPKTRLLLIGSSVGRVAGVLAACALCVVAYPGWVHPEPNHPATARRVAWGVEPEPSLLSAAEQFKRWHDTGRLPADARGVIVNVDLANYVAWFAPQEKVFFNARYNHHGRELPDYLALRKALGLIEVKDYRPSAKDAAEVLARAGAEYVAIHAGPADISALRSRATEISTVLFRRWEEWSVWYLDGRTTVFGWRPAGAPAKPTFAGLRVDPGALAFGPDVRRVPDPVLTQPLTPLGWEEPFVRPARAAPTGGAEALAWGRYKDALIFRQQVRVGLLRQTFFGFPATPAYSLPSLALWAADGRGLGPTRLPSKAQEDRALETVPLIWFFEGRGALRFAPQHPEAEDDGAALRAAPILALRAARRAIAENPDHPDPYFALALALKDPDLPLSESERVLGAVTAYRQCLSRLPSPDRYRRGQFAADPVDVAVQLASIYLGQPVGGRVDPKTGQETIRGFIGMPVDVAPLNELLGEAVFEDPAGKLVRVPVVALGRVRFPPGFRLLTGNTPVFLPLDLAREALKLALAYAATDLAGGPTEAAQRRAQEVEKLLKSVDAAVIRANEQFDPIRARAPGLPDLVEAARHSGLIGEALRLMAEKDTDLAKEYKDREPYAAVLRVSLELALGRIENANDLLQYLDAPNTAPALEKAGEARRVLLLRYQKELHAGAYKAAGELWEAIAGGGIGALDKMPPPGPTVERALVLDTLAVLHEKPSAQEAEKTLAALLGPPLVPLTPLTQPLTLQLWQGEWFAATQLIQQRIGDQLQADANFFYRRGVLSLLEGDIPAAKQRFQQSTRKAPKGWGLDDLRPLEPRLYLQLIEAAEKGAAP